MKKSKEEIKKERAKKDYIERKNKLIVDNYVLIYKNILKLLNDSSEKNQEIMSMAKEPVIPTVRTFGGGVPASYFIMFMDEMLQKTYPTLGTTKDRFLHAGLRCMLDYYDLIPQIRKAEKGEELIKNIQSCLWKIELCHGEGYSTARDNNKEFYDNLKDLKLKVEYVVEQYKELCDLFPGSYKNETNIL